jgi:hypothetical protein
MKHYFTLLLACCLCAASQAQVSNYTFSNTTGTYTALGAGATTVFSGGFFSAFNPVTVTIPAFNYYGVSYTQMTIFCNGYVQIGGPSLISSGDRLYPINNNGISSTTTDYGFMPMTIAPFAGDYASNASANALVKWQVVGSEVVVEWHGLRNQGGSLSVDMQFQLRLNTTTNVIRFVYNNFANALSANPGQIGLRRTLATKDAVLAGIKFSGSSNWGAWNNPIIHSNIGSLDSGRSEIFTGIAGIRYPDNGRTFVFTPVANCTGTPSLSGTSIITPKGTSFCKGERGVVALTGLPNSNQLRFRWETAPVGSSTFTTVSGQYKENDTTFELVTDTLMASRQFRCVVTCTASGLSSTSNTVTLNPVSCRFNAALGTSKTTPSLNIITASTPASWKNGTNTGENMSNAVPIGFPFNFKGMNYSNAYLSTNGFITFDAAATTSTYSNSFSTTAQSNTTKSVIAPFYTDLQVDALTSIYYITTGTAPNRIFSVYWLNAKYQGTPANSTALMTFEVHLYETTGAIVFNHNFMRWYETNGLNYDGQANLSVAILGERPSIVTKSFYSPAVGNKLSYMCVLEKADSLIFQDFPVGLPNGISCGREYRFTPAENDLGIPSLGSSYPMSTNDHTTPANAIPLVFNANGGACQYRTSYQYRNKIIAPTTAGACATHQEGWFKFAPLDINQQTIFQVVGLSNINPQVSILDDNLTALAGFSCVNATGEGATETLTVPAGSFQAGRNYYLRVGANSSFLNFLDYSYLVLPINVAAALPVQLIDFTAQLKGNNQAQLNWRTAQAINFSHFEIEHSTDGRQWEKIGQLTYQSTNDQYQFLHSQLSKGTHFYRLKQMDKDGKFEYSKIAKIEVKAGLNVSIAPSLVTNRTTINMQLDQAATVSVRVLNTAGQMVYSKTMQVNAGNQQWPIDCQQWADGTYIINLFSNQEFLAGLRVVKMK